MDANNTLLLLDFGMLCCWEVTTLTSIEDIDEDSNKDGDRIQAAICWIMSWRI